MAAAGFVTEPGTDQTHNVVDSIPGDPGYSPLWNVTVYDSSRFDAVSDLASAKAAGALAAPPALVNCPIVEVPP